jgi:hypothetical protein
MLPDQLYARAELYCRLHVPTIVMSASKGMYNKHLYCLEEGCFMGHSIHYQAFIKGMGRVCFIFVHLLYWLGSIIECSS